MMFIYGILSRTIIKNCWYMWVGKGMLSNWILKFWTLPSDLTLSIFSGNSLQFKLCPYSMGCISQYKLELQSKNTNLGQNRQVLIPCDLEISTMTLKNNRTPLPCYFKICPSFRNHQWIQTQVTGQKPRILVKNRDFWSILTLKIDRWPWRTIGHLFYATSSFVHHFIALLWN